TGIGTDTLTGIVSALGSDFADTIIGSAGDDFLFDGGGADRITGGAGNDAIFLGVDGANDTVIGGEGTDLLSYANFGAAGGVSVDLSLGIATDFPDRGSAGGGIGVDSLSGIEIVVGTDNADLFRGGTAAETFLGGGGDDVLRLGADSQNDAFTGGGGIDSVDYSEATGPVIVDLSLGEARSAGGSAGSGIGTDRLVGVEGVIGSAFADTLIGGAGNELFFDGGGADRISGGAGDDSIFLAADNANDTILGGDGTDILSYTNSGSTRGVSVNLATGVATDLVSGGSAGSGIGTDAISGVEIVVGTGLTDVLVGSGADETFVGGGGPDTIEAGGGNDVVFVNPDGGDLVFGGAGTDTLVVDGQSSAYTISGSAGTSTLTSGTGSPIRFSGIEFLQFADGGVAVAPPSDILLSRTIIAENVSGATLGTLSVVDPDSPFVVSLSDSRFELVNGSIVRLRAGQKLDFETEPSLTLQVTATDITGLSATKSFAISVADGTDLTVAPATGAEDTTIALSLSASPGADSASLSLTITGVNEGAALSAGSNLGGGVWSLTSAQLAGLKLIPAANSDADLVLTVTAAETLAGTSISTSATLAVTVNAVADAPTVNFSSSASGVDGPVGGEFRVNSFTTLSQSSPSVTSLGNGGFVVTWDSLGQDGSVGGIYAQRYTSAGLTEGGEFRVNSFTTGSQTSPSVTSIGDGGFVVTWSSVDQDGDGNGIYAQRYTSAGVAAGSEFRVTSYVPLDEFFPSVTALGDGGFVVTWASYEQDGFGFGIYAQRFDTVGATTGSEFRVNSYTTVFFALPSVTALGDGGFVVTWDSLGQDGDSRGIYAQRYDSAGVAAGSEFRVNSYTT
ncbi:MAG: beta strand repeat-containing protein, partial [Rhodospirillales bacterium]